MRFSFKAILAAATLSAGVFVAGCQSTNASRPASTTADKTLACPNCDAKVVKAPIDGGKGRVVGYTTKKEMNCSDCKDAVANLFATGKFEHTCASCPDAAEMCKTH